MDKVAIDNRIVFFEWEAPMRYFEEKPPSYFKAVVSIAVLVSLLLFFLKEFLLLMVVWVIVFVAYVKALVPPLHIRYKLTKFGIQFYTTTINYKNIHAFSLIKRPQAQLLRFIMYGGLEWTALLPSDKHQGDEIISFLKERVPFLEHIPETEIDKMANWLKRVIGLG